MNCTQSIVSKSDQYKLIKQGDTLRLCMTDKFNKHAVHAHIRSITKNITTDPNNDDNSILHQ